MRIYIDESGAFIPTPGRDRVCCVAALGVPEATGPRLLAEFVALRESWTSEPEIKGSSLTDEQTTAALRLFGSYDVVARITALNGRDHTDGALRAFQAEQVDRFNASLTPDHNQNARQWVQSLIDEWSQLPPQLVAQLYTLVLTIEEVIRDVPTYYAQRAPEELGRFDWFVDPKDVTPTRYDQLWQRMVCPLLQSMSMSDPWGRVAGLDYSHFDRYDMVMLDYLLPHLPAGARHDRATGIDLRKLLFESASFPSSKDEAGLQIVDIVASAFTKAMNGRLPETLWPLLAGVMLQRQHNEPPVRMVAFGQGDGSRIPAEAHHTHVLRLFTQYCKPMLTEETRGR